MLWLLVGAVYALSAVCAVLGAHDAVDLDTPPQWERDEYDTDRLIRWLAAEGQMLLEAERRRAP